HPPAGVVTKFEELAMDLPNLPMSRFERWCLVLFKKPVLWALMVCTGGAALMMVDGIAQTQMPTRSPSAAKSTAPASLAAGSTTPDGPASTVSLENRSDDSSR